MTAVDLHEPFLDELRTAAEARGLTASIDTVDGDMGDLHHPDGSFDLGWAEGSAYLMGFDTALRQLAAFAHRRHAGPHPLCVDHRHAVRPGSRVLGGRLAAHDRPGHPGRAQRRVSVLGVSSQPESDWDEYYDALGVHAEDVADVSRPGMAEAVAGARAEIAMRREHQDAGYVGYVLRPVTVGA